MNYEELRMNYEELSRIPNALDILNIMRTMKGAAEAGTTHLELYINNLKKLYPNIEEAELNKIVEEFKADMAKQVEDNDYEGVFCESSENFAYFA